MIIKTLFVIIGSISATRIQTSCLGGFWNTQQCVSCLNQYCSCTSAKGCNSITCPQGMVLNPLQQTCILCPYGCSQCILLEGVQNYQCSECSLGYQLIEGICVRLTVRGSPVFLNSTRLGFTLSYTQLMITSPLVLSCEQYSITDSTCLDCPENSFFNEYGQCEQCVQGCIQCNSRGTCLQCGGYQQWFANGNLLPLPGITGSGQCQGCIVENAKICDPTGLNVDSCQTGYYLSSNQCIKCPIQNCGDCNKADICLLCQEGYQLQSEQTECSICTQNSDVLSCLVCPQQDLANCDICNIKLGYENYNGKCINCQLDIDLGCQTCQTMQYGNVWCQACQDGYYLDLSGVQSGTGTQCFTCASFDQYAIYCYKDDNQTNIYSKQILPVIITQCQVGYLLSTNQCIQNTNDCLLVRSVAGDCLTCLNQNWFVIQGKCLNCQSLEGCQICVPEETTLICVSCINGKFNSQNYVLNVETNLCVKCTENCLACSLDGTCQICSDGYFLQKIDLTCEACAVQGCNQCNIDNECVVCEPGFYLKSVVIENVQQNLCLLCPPGCLQCSKNYGQSCDSCKKGYYPQGQGCSRGVDYCALFTGGQCVACKYGARLSAGGCHPCIDFSGAYVCGQNAGFISTYYSFSALIQLIYATIMLLLLQ